MFDAPDRISFCLDESYQLVLWNASFETITGYGGQKSGRIRLSDVIEIQDLADVEQAIVRAREDGHATVNCHLIGGDGRGFPCRLILEPLQTHDEALLSFREVDDAAGRPAGFLSSSTETLRRIFNHSNDGIFVYDHQQDVIVEANPRACRMLEFSRDELLSMSITDIIPRGFDQPSADEGGEMICEMKSGRRFPAEISVSTIELGGRPCLIVLVRDIHERKRIEEAEKDLERLASFPELNRHPIVEVTARGEITYHNPAAAKHFPVLNVLDELSDSGPVFPLVDCLHEVVHTLNTRSVDRLVRELATGPSVYEVHASQIRPQQVIRIYLYDVTERKLAEAEVTELKSFYQNVLGDLPTELAVFDRTGRYIYLNRAAVSDDTVRQWLIGRTSIDYARYRGLDPELFEHRHEWLQETIRSKETRERLEIMIDDDGTERHKLRIVTPVLDDDDDVKYALGYGLDLTERKKASEALRREQEFTEEVINSLDDVFFACDLDGQLLRWNNHLTRLSGYADEEIEQMHPKEFVPESEVDKVLQQIIKGAETGEFAFETRLQTKSGDILPCEVIGSYLEWNDRTVVTGIGRDITERKKHERQLIEAKESAEEMSRLKSAFLANMSHEIRTPLTAILGFADVLREEMMPEENEFVELIHRSGERLLHTLDSVLDLAQLEAGSKTIEPRTVDLVQQITEPIEMLTPQAEMKGLTLSLDAPDEPVTATVDPAGLVRVVTNLISNGIKFTQDGRVIVRVRPNGQYVEIDVEDTGCGIDESFQDQLFMAFKQESTGLDRSHEGTGLGLTIVKQLTELMHGSVSVESTKGEGSVFTVRLPRV